jgi:peptidoglycan/LPS O-acetylase OafA/YrhL
MYSGSSFSGYIDGLVPYWSLEVEELFYLLWAPVVLKCSRRAITVFAVAPLIVCPILRGLAHTVHFWEFYGFLTRLDTLAVGGCLALLLKARPRLPRWIPLAAIPPVLAALGWLCAVCGLFRGVEIRSTEMFSILGYSFLALLFGCVIATCVLWESHPALALLRLRPVVYIGTISYTMYLIHVEIFLLLSRLSGVQVLRGMAAMSVTVAVAALSWKYFETPILRLRNWPERWRRSAGTSVTANAGCD